MFHPLGDRREKMENSIHFVFLLLFLFIFKGMANMEAKQTQVYIVYLGDKPHNDHELIIESHFDILGHVVGSKKAAESLMVYNYKHSFSGFAAKLTKDQAKKMADLPGVLRVMPDRLHRVKNTWSWNSMGLSHNIPNNLLHKANMGDGDVIGVIDSGIWPESKAFNEDGLGPIPSHWKGSCMSAGPFNASKHCNKKIIGAKYYNKGYLEMIKALGKSDPKEEKNQSPIDENGHGSHTASTAAGSFVSNISYLGINFGTFRGGAPRARLAIYKIAPDDNMVDSDVVSAMDDAVRDGVDVISVSLGPSFPVGPEIEAVALGALHAVANGVHVIVSEGNEGPGAYTALDCAPWTISVASADIDRTLVVPITLGNNQTSAIGRGHLPGNRIGFVGLRDGENSDGNDNSEIQGNVAIFFAKNMTEADTTTLNNFRSKVAMSGGVACIVTRPITHEFYMLYNISADPQNRIPLIEVEYEAGNQIYNYLLKSRASGVPATVMLEPSKVFEGKPLAYKIPIFSSRGPNPIAPEILKPDIAAPGTNIIAVVPPGAEDYDNGFAMMSGTSMAAPHISGIVALLKVLHPNWSPAAIKSALITTAWNEDSYEIPIITEGLPMKEADHFDYGGGIVNPDGAADPGLVYEMNKDDYLNYLCSQNYFPTSIYDATKDFPVFNVTSANTVCQNRSISLLDLNFPSITIPYLGETTTVRRTVTNVGPMNSVYRAKIKSPEGTQVSVEPTELKFDSKTTNITFYVKVTPKLKTNSGYTFGSLIWTDDKHFVRSPISVRRNEIRLY